ncbi:MAG: response regulator [Candidatus Zixiibacteriota bacterium]
MDDSKKKSVLVVDDEEIIRNFLSEVLSEDYCVSMASDGDEAIEQIKQRKFDLIITDLKMPKVSGEEVVKFAHQHDSRAKVIVISGFSNLYSVNESIKCGARAFLAKPFSIRELKQSVKEAING